MATKVFVVRAFTREIQGGNQAGVVINADDLEQEARQAIATKLNFSETAFISNSDKADKKVEFYTPVRQIPFCGHATIASWSVLLKEKIITPGEYSQEVVSGVLKISVAEDGKIIMDQTLPVYGVEVEIDELSNVLDIPVDWLKVDGLKPQLVNTGLNDLLVPVDSREHLFAIPINENPIKEFQIKYNLDSLHLFTFEAIDPDNISNSRNTDPKDNIPDESATGSAHGALSCYLLKNRKLTAQQAAAGITYEQGDSLGCPSRINAIIDTESDKIIRVRVGGYAVIDKSIEM